MMRSVRLCFVLGGCSILDGIADNAPNPQSFNRVFLGSESIRVHRRRELDRYTCGHVTMVCTPYGSQWECSCAKVTFQRF